MPFFRGKRVSAEWHTVLTAAERAGVRFQLNSGRRTMAEQWALYRQYKRTGWPVAAYPNPNAPHIRTGRSDHALDVDTDVGDGESGLQAWLARQGLPTRNTVRGEPWHLEARSAADLRRLAKRLGRVERLRARYERVKAQITKRQRQGKASPGLRKLLKRLRKQIGSAR